MLRYCLLLLLLQPPLLLMLLLGRALGLALAVAGLVWGRQAGAVGRPAELTRGLQRLDFVACQKAPARSPNPPRCMVVPGLVQVGLQHKASSAGCHLTSSSGCGITVCQQLV